jgi:hypothetical protein
MEELGEQYTVVALMVTEPASECVGGGGATLSPPAMHQPLPLTIYATTTVHCSSDSSMAEYELRMTSLT